MPRIELNSRYCIKNQTSKIPFISAKELLLTSLKRNIRLFEDLLKLVLEQNMLRYRTRITVNVKYDIDGMFVNCNWVATRWQ